jgi:hypothetical protein
MGYTHYWRVRPTADAGAWREALVEAAEIVRHSPVSLAGWDGNGEPELSEDGIRFNGVGELAHETFELLADPARYEPAPWGESIPGYVFSFCKTARKPYDIVVTALLAALHDRLGPSVIIVTSDGDPQDWADGCQLASCVLGRQIACPPLKSR